MFICEQCVWLRGRRSTCSKFEVSMYELIWQCLWMCENSHTVIFRFYLILTSHISNVCVYLFRTIVCLHCQKLKSSPNCYNLTKNKTCSMSEAAEHGRANLFLNKINNSIQRKIHMKNLGQTICLFKNPNEGYTWTRTVNVNKTGRKLWFAR